MLIILFYFLFWFILVYYFLQEIGLLSLCEPMCVIIFFDFVVYLYTYLSTCYQNLGEWLLIFFDAMDSFDNQVKLLDHFSDA